MDIGWQNNHNEYLSFFSHNAKYTVFQFLAMKWLISMPDLVIFEVYAPPSAQIDCE